MHAPKKESCGREWWLETHKWFYGWEVNKNQERGQVVLAVHSGWGDLKEEGMKMCAGCRCMFLDPSGWPFLILPFFPFWWRMKRYSRGMCVDWSGWGGQYQPFLDFPQCQPSSSFKPFLCFTTGNQIPHFEKAEEWSQMHIQMFNCSIVQNSCRTNPSLASSVDVHQIKSSRMQITRWHRVGGATNQSNRSLAFTVTASVTVAICLRPIIGKHKQYLDLRDSSRSSLVMASLKQRWNFLRRFFSCPVR